LDHTVYTEELDELDLKATHQFIQKGYYGGRTEVFKRGTFYDVSCYDINSMYPFAMTKDYPVPSSARYAHVSSEHIIHKYHGMTRCVVRVPKHIYIPPLPIRHEQRLIFPTGILSGVWNHVELRYALLLGCELVECFESVYYTKSHYYFKQYIHDMYDQQLLHKAQNNPLQSMDKLMLNSLYGRFAFRYDTGSSVTTTASKQTCDDIDAAAGITPLHNGFMRVNIEHTDVDIPDFVFPIWSCTCTAYSRVMMHEYLTRVEVAGKVLYCDTDSIFTHDNTTMSTSKALGCLKLEDGYPIDRATFVRPKFYKTEKTKIKGIRGGFTYKGVVYTDDMLFKQALSHQPVLQRRFIKHRTALSGRTPMNAVRFHTTDLDLEDIKRDWDNTVFNPDIQQDSKPLHVDMLTTDITGLVETIRQTLDDDLIVDINISDEVSWASLER
jgi:hypothetical protein